MDPTVTFDEYGLVVAADAFAQMLCSPLFGYMADKMGQIRLVSYICSTFFIGGNVMFSLLALLPRGENKIRVWMMLVSRLIVGTGTSKKSSKYIDKKYRARHYEWQ